MIIYTMGKFKSSFPHLTEYFLEIQGIDSVAVGNMTEGIAQVVFEDLENAQDNHDAERAYVYMNVPYVGGMDPGASDFLSATERFIDEMGDEAIADLIKAYHADGGKNKILFRHYGLTQDGGRRTRRY